MSRVSAVLAGVGLLAFALPAAAACPPKKGAEAAVVRAVGDMYAALRADDAAAFRAATTPNFRAFDVGQDMSGDALVRLVVSAHAAGKRYEWSVNEPTVRLACDLAFVSYINRGWVDDATGRTTLLWLESASVEYRDGRWRVAFLHSTRAKAQP